MVRVINFRSFSSFFLWDLGPLKIIEKCVSDGRGHKFQKFLKFLFFELWALLESFKNDSPMIRAKMKSQKFLKFFF